jgi:hypothetical protein
MHSTARSAGWDLAHDGVGCDRQTFIRILEELEFMVGDVEGTTLVSGIVFRSDLKGLDPVPGWRS